MKNRFGRNVLVASLLVLPVMASLATAGAAGTTSPSSMTLRASDLPKGFVQTQIDGPECRGACRVLSEECSKRRDSHVELSWGARACNGSPPGFPHDREAVDRTKFVSRDPAIRRGGKRGLCVPHRLNDSRPE